MSHTVDNLFNTWLITALKMGEVVIICVAWQVSLIVFLTSFINECYISVRAYVCASVSLLVPG